MGERGQGPEGRSGAQCPLPPTQEGKEGSAHKGSDVTHLSNRTGAPEGRALAPMAGERFQGGEGVQRACRASPEGCRGRG